MKDRQDAERTEPLLTAFDADNPHGGVAVILRETREGFGEELRAVATSLRIRYVYLLAIEEGRFDDLPGHTYAVGFVRTYAEYLGLDSDQMVRLFKEEVRGLDRKTELVFPTPVPEGKVPGGAILLLSIVLCAVAYGGWLYLSNQGRSVAELIPQVPEHLQSLLSGEGGAAPAEEPPGASSLALAESGAAVGPAAVPGGATGGEAQAPSAASRPLAGPSTIEPPVAAPADDALPQQAISVARPGELAAAAGDDAAPSTEPRFTGTQSTAAAPGQAPSGQVPSGQVPSGQAAAGESAPLASAGDPAAAAQPDQTAAPIGSLADVVARNDQAADLAAGASGAAEAQASTPSPTGQGSDAALGAATGGAGAIPAAPEPTRLADLAQGREPQIFGAENQNARIVLRARYDSWVQVRDSQDTLLLTRVLRSGDSYLVPNQVGLTLLTGNAGGLEIQVDGRTLAPLGPLGAVRRDVLLDPQQLIQGTAISN